MAALALIVAFLLFCLSLFTAMGSWVHYERKLKRRCEEVRRLMDESEERRKKLLTRRIAEERQAARTNAKREMDRALAEERTKIQAILARFYRLQPSLRHSDYGARYRVAVDFDRDMVLLCRHGDHQDVEYLVEMLSHQIRRELLTLNFERFRDPEVGYRESAARRRQYAVWRDGSPSIEDQSFAIRRGDPPE